VPTAKWFYNVDSALHISAFITLFFVLSVVARSIHCSAAKYPDELFEFKRVR